MRTTLTLAAAAAVTAAAPAGPPAGPPAAPKRPALERRAAAHTLARFGREQKSPLALLAAAEVLRAYPAGPKAVPPEGLIARAHGLLTTPAERAAWGPLRGRLGEKPRGAPGGPVEIVYVLKPRQRFLKPIRFAGGQWAEVRAEVLGDAAVGLKVSDPANGVNLQDGGRAASARWFQRAAGRVNVILTNPNDFELRVAVLTP